MRREIAADIVPQSGIVHADAQLDMHSGERFPSALAAKHKRSRLRESHDPVKGHCDRRTLDRGAGLSCREDHILRQLRIVSDPDDRHMQCRQARTAGKGEGSTIVIGDCGRLLLDGIRRAKRKEKSVSAGVAFVPPSATIFVVSEVEGHLVHGISVRHDPPRRFQNAPKDTPKGGDIKNKKRT
jgi:hypothetical protein